MFNQYVICSKREGGTALIALKEYKGYSDLRKRLEFNLCLTILCPDDEVQVIAVTETLRPVIQQAHIIGFGHGVAPFDGLFKSRKKK